MISLEPIGIIHSPFKAIANMPIQPKGAMDIVGEILINLEMADGLTDLDGFSHIYLLYHLHQAPATKLRVIPFMDTVERGVFATRSPMRPNHIGLSIVELVSVKNNVVTIKGVDVLDGTPLLDIKPFIYNFDYVENSKSGWMTGSRDAVKNKRSHFSD